VDLLGSGAILNQVLKAQEMLESRYGVAATVWSATSYKELMKDAVRAERWNMLHPDRPPKTPYVSAALGESPAVVAASDYSKALPLIVSRWLPRDFLALGTDGFGRSEGRSALRNFFEVDDRYVAVGALHTLARRGEVERSLVTQAIKDLDIDPEKADPAVS
jgi:pyruvate dehydrogenase E1 component